MVQMAVSMTLSLVPFRLRPLPAPAAAAEVVAALVMVLPALVLTMIYWVLFSKAVTAWSPFRADLVTVPVIWAVATSGFSAEVSAPT